VCFTVWTSGTRKEGDWAYYVSSVVVFGTASLVTDSDLLREKLRAIGLKYYPTAEEVDMEIQRDLRNVQMIAVHVDHMTGKLVHEK
jgi:nitroimidazol reductase NimA-like FMN-containing flavoprotein (pyridoxamine 5'-phosphate oxidase superfamily)